MLVYGLEKGNLEHVFSGDEPGRHTGELLGHSGVITALFFYKHTVYTGSMDCTVQARKNETTHGVMYPDTYTENVDARTHACTHTCTLMHGFCP